jgi:hypothetical protein
MGSIYTPKRTLTLAIIIVKILEGVSGIEEVLSYRLVRDRE